MKTKEISPNFPDDPQNENGPTHRTTDKKGQVSDNALEKDAPAPAGNQAPTDDERDLFSFAAAAPESLDPDDLTSFAAAAPEPLDPEDLTSFALNEDHDFSVAKKVLTTVPVRKPSKEGFVRTTPDPDGWKVYTILELKEEGKTYLVHPQLAAALEAEGESTLVKARLVPAVDRLGNFFLWLLKTSERESSWHLSALRAAERAKTDWVRVQSNLPAGVYDTQVALSLTSQPQWPEENLATILKIAFDGRVISSRDHPVLKELRGDF
jgi:hypothetical protein